MRQLESETVAGLYREAKLGNVIAARFLLCNLFPARWRMNPTPTMDEFLAEQARRSAPAG